MTAVLIKLMVCPVSSNRWLL